MNEPNRCIDCGKTIPPNQIRCHECHANYWLDEVYEGEGGSVPDYDDDDELYDDDDFSDWES